MNVLKYIIVGDSGVGKTSIALRYTDNVFLDRKPTIGVDFFNKYTGNVKINIWDTAGACRFKSIISSFYRLAVGAIIVYDVSNRESFESIPQWIEEIKEHANPQIMIVGNKSDKERQVTLEEAKNFAYKNKVLYYEVSAKNGTNIKESFELLNSITFKNVSPLYRKPLEKSKLLENKFFEFC